MPAPAFDRDFWEALWTRTLRDHAEKVAQRPPNRHVIDQAGGLSAGHALDAGCGHGAESLWLASRGWKVTAVDVSEAALAHGRRQATAACPGLASRIAWHQRDLAEWSPEPRAYDLVVMAYVHIPGDVSAAVQRLAAGVAPGGTLLLIGHQALDPETGEPTIAAAQVQVSLADVAALNAHDWTPVVAEHRPRAAGGGVDAVICLRRACAAS